MCIIKNLILKKITSRHCFSKLNTVAVIGNISPCTTEYGKSVKPNIGKNAFNVFVFEIPNPFFDDKQYASNIQSVIVSGTLILSLIRPKPLYFVVKLLS